MQVFAKLAPEAVKHEFGRGFTSGIFLDHVWIEGNTFFLSVLAHVACFVFGGVAPGRVASGFLLDFEPGVDIISEESYLSFFEAPHFVDLEESVTHLNGFAEFWGAPGPSEGTLLGRV